MIGDRKTNIFGKLVRQKVVIFEEVGSHVFVFTLVLHVTTTWRFLLTNLLTYFVRADLASPRGIRSWT